MDTIQFVGPKKVSLLVIDTVKTHNGFDVVVVNYEDGSKELMSKKTFELVVTNEPSDYTTVRSKKFKQMYREIYSILGDYFEALSFEQDIRNEAKTNALKNFLAVISEYDIKVSEIEPFINQINVEANVIVNALGYELDCAFNRATNYLWTNSDKDFVPGVNMMNDRTFLESRKIIDSIPVVQETKNDAQESKPSQDTVK